MKNMKLVHGFLAAAGLPMSAIAACGKADIQFLLENGFTVAEARTACTMPPDAVRRSAPAFSAPRLESRAPIASAPTPPSSVAPPLTKSSPPAQVEVTKTTQVDGETVSKEVQTGGISDFTQGWGVGLAALRNRRTVINDASLVNGLVRANTVQSWQPELLLARHWYFSSAPNYHSCSVSVKGACLGMFLAIGVGGGSGSSTTQVVDMAGVGLLFGFGPGTKNPQQQAHNIGIGVGRRFNVKMLGDGISANASLPAGETQIRYKTEDITAPFVFYTYKFGS